MTCHICRDSQRPVIALREEMRLHGLQVERAEALLMFNVQSCETQCRETMPSPDQNCGDGARLFPRESYRVRPLLF